MELGPDAPESELLERAAELEAIGRLIDEARHERGGFVLVEGPAGTGKSSLLRAGRECGGGAGLRVLRARGSELETGFAFGVMRQLLEPALGRARDEQRDRWLAGRAAPARVILADAPAPSAHPADTGGMLLALHRLLGRIADDGPLLLIVDDAHWADPSSLRSLSYLAGRLSGASVALLVAVRTGEPGAPEALLDGLREEPDAVRLAPAPLGAASVGRLVRRRLPGADPVAEDAVWSATAGNPLLVEELLRLLTADGRLARADPAAAVRAAALPALGERLERRIAPEGERAPALAAAMAVLGDGSRLADAAELARLPLDEAGAVAHRLERIEVLAAQDPFAFVHPLVRRSVYDAQPQTAREAAHHRAAGILERRGVAPAVVAAHLDAVTPSGSERTAAALLAAGETALAEGAPQEAVRWLRRAVAEEPPPARPLLLARLGAAEAALRDPAAPAHLEEALAGAPGPEQGAPIAAALAEAHLIAGRWDLGLDVVRRAQAASPAADPQLAAIEAFVSAYDVNHVEALEGRRAAMAGLTEGEGRAAAGLAAVLAAVAAHRGEIAASRELLARAQAGGLLLEEPTLTAAADTHLLIALIELEDLTGAHAAASAMYATAQRDGALGLTLAVLDHRAWIHARGGDLPAAESDLRASIALATTAQSPTAALSQAFYGQDALLERPELDDLARWMLETELDARLASTWIGTAALAARGRLRLARRDRFGAVADLRASHEGHRALLMGPTVSPSGSQLALALPDADAEEARALVDEELRLARDTGLARPIGVALRAAGILAGGEEGIERLRESAAVLADSPARLEHARTLVELGTALHRARRDRDARDELKAGLALAERCGATRLTARARTELAAAGVDPRRLPSAANGLTASERRVATLAAEGVANREIARELFLSLKTVESHLYSAYRKLGLRGHGSRARLRDALERAGRGRGDPRA